MGIIADSKKISIPNNVVIPKKYINKKYITSEIPKEAQYQYQKRLIK
jgi:hypothetical protein